MLIYDRPLVTHRAIRPRQHCCQPDHPRPRQLHVSLRCRLAGQNKVLRGSETAATKIRDGNPVRQRATPAPRPRFRLVSIWPCRVTSLVRKHAFIRKQKKEQDAVAEDRSGNEPQA